MEKLFKKEQIKISLKTLFTKEKQLLQKQKHDVE